MIILRAASTQLPSYMQPAGRVFETTWGQFHQCVYSQLLCSQILKVQKGAWVDCLFALFGSVGVKAVQKNVGEIDPTSKLYFVRICLLGPIFFNRICFWSSRCFTNIARINWVNISVCICPVCKGLYLSRSGNIIKVRVMHLNNQGNQVKCKPPWCHHFANWKTIRCCHWTDLQTSSHFTHLQYGEHRRM